VYRVGVVRVERAVRSRRHREWSVSRRASHGARRGAPIASDRASGWMRGVRRDDAIVDASIDA
jgi:hypothetical protein